MLGASTDGDAVTAQIEAADGARSCSARAARRRRSPRRSRGPVPRSSSEAGATLRWPPSADGFDVLVNATPVKDEVIVPPTTGMQVVDLAYNADGAPTALVVAAREAGCDLVVDGLDVLLFQGAASFERWTGLPAPIVTMREALRGS